MAELKIDKSPKNSSQVNDPQSFGQLLTDMSQAFFEELGKARHRVTSQSTKSLMIEGSVGLVGIALARVGLNPSLAEQMPILSQELQTSTLVVTRALTDAPRLSANLQRITRLPQTAEEAIERGPQLAKALADLRPELPANMGEELRIAFNTLLTLATGWSNGHK